MGTEVHVLSSELGELFVQCLPSLHLLPSQPSESFTVIRNQFTQKIEKKREW